MSCSQNSLARLSLLVRKEVELAATEMTVTVRTAASHAATIAAGGALAHAGLLVLLAAVVLGLVQLGVSAWLSALIVAVVVMAAGYGMVSKGLGRMRTTMSRLRERSRA